MKQQQTRYRFSLGKMTMRCPACGQKTFKPYVDNADGSIVDASVGRCNREVKCAYHLAPREYFAMHPRVRPTALTPSATAVRPSVVRPDYIPPEVVEGSLKKIESDVLFGYLAGLFGHDIALKVCRAYNVGSRGGAEGSTLFWLTDRRGRFRSGKSMRYGSDGHRLKIKGAACVSWAHSLLGLKDFVYASCLFGEHLAAANPDARLYIFESEKTALMFTAYMVYSNKGQHVFHEQVALATGGSGALKTSSWEMDCGHYKLNILRGREVVLVPDADAVDKWSRYSVDLKPYVRDIRVVDLRRMPVGLSGSEDYADYVEREMRKA